MDGAEALEWRRLRRRERRRGVLLAAAALAALLLGMLWLSRPPPSPAPSPGRVLPGGAVVAWSPGYRVSFYGLERLHPFDVGKYDRIAAALIDGGRVPADAFLVPEEAPQALLAAVHDPAYLASLAAPVTLSEAMDMTVPGFMSPAAIDARLLAPFRRAVGGTVAAARGALAHGLGINLGGGFHHARPAAGGGFCVYNDVAAALHALRADGWRGRALIVDTDAHQGDGNHAFFADDPQVFSLSLHQGGIFPVPKLHGDADITFDGGADDGELLAALEAALAPALEDFRPDLVFHVAGSDVLGDDPLAGLAMSVEGLVRRDLLVTGAVRGRGIPLVHLLAGGYGPSSARAQARSVAALLEHAARGAP